MIYRLLSNFCLTNSLSEFESNDSLTKIDLRMEVNHLIAVSHSLLNVQKIIVYYNDLNQLKSFLKKFLIECGGGKSYEKDFNDILNMNLGLIN